MHEPWSLNCANFELKLFYLGLNTLLQKLILEFQACCNYVSYCNLKEGLSWYSATSSL